MDAEKIITVLMEIKEKQDSHTKMIAANTEALTEIKESLKILVQDAHENKRDISLLKQVK